MRVELQMFKAERLSTFKIIFRIQLDNADVGNEDDLREFMFLVVPKGCVFQSPLPKEGYSLTFRLKDMRSVVRKKRRHYTFVGTGLCNSEPMSMEIHTLFRQNYVGTSKAEILEID